MSKRLPPSTSQSPRKKGRTDHENGGHNDPLVPDPKSQLFNLHPESPLPTPNAQTVTVALTSSFIEHFEKAELRTYAAGQISRALALFCVDEVVVFPEAPPNVGRTPKNLDGTFESASKKKLDGAMFLGRLLQYLETPPKALFPVHRDLKFAGLINPLEAPHHMRLEDQSLFREGVTTNRKTESGTVVDCGMQKEVVVDRVIKPNVRVTVKINLASDVPNEKHVKGSVVGPSVPKEKYGLYWGYRTRVAPSISKVISECPYKEGYDLTIGVSEKGTGSVKALDEKRAALKGYKHVLIVLGGSKGLEYSIGCDEDLKVDEDDAGELFDLYVNLNPRQGSRTIRTEENIMVSLAALSPYLHPE
ncbi:hypothetical protein HDU97_008226 [Phlyctochytrium planicorne]|nr:hypothetical protein HDU97_008226 [Phlyctochytrium planicorne]